MSHISVKFGNIIILDTVKKLYSNFCALSPDEKLAFLRLVNRPNVVNKKIKFNKQKNSIKIWPYLDDFSQAIIPYSSDHLSDDANMVVNFDFSKVKRANSSGAAIALMKLISGFSKRKNPFRLIPPEDPIMERYFQESGFFAILNENFYFINDLFDNIKINKFIQPYIVNDEKTKIVSFPIFHLKYNAENIRESVDNFMDWITDIIFESLSRYNVQCNTLLTILIEIAKNSQDHTNSDSYFGLDIILDTITNKGELYFSFPDLGIGITRKVREDETVDYRRAKEKFAYTDAYKFAFALGKTTSKNPINKGIGMSLIRDGAEILNLDLTIWDADSMLFIPKILTHSELRRIAFDTGNSVGFNYYGRLRF